MVREADVVIENYRPGVMDAGARLRAQRDQRPASSMPRSLVSGATVLVLSGPDTTSWREAMGGIMSITGQPNDPPTRVGIPSAIFWAA